MDLSMISESNHFELNDLYSDALTTSTSPSPPPQIPDHVMDKFEFNVKCNGLESKVLPDTGAQLCLVSKQLAHRLGLQIQEGAPRQVRFGNKQVASLSGRVVIKIEKGRYSQQIECYVGEISQDIILGTPWCSKISCRRNL